MVMPTGVWPTVAAARKVAMVVATVVAEEVAVEVVVAALTAVAAMVVVVAPVAPNQGIFRGRRGHLPRGSA